MTSRAKQFMPFAALKGYYDLIKDAEKTVEPRHELNEDDALRLSQTVAKLARGSVVRVTYYEDDGYITKDGAITSMDFAIRRLWLVHKEIAFDDIANIELL
jgi:hypothetical protein